MPHVETSIHAVAIVLVCVLAEHLKLSIAMNEADGRMPDAVEHGGLHGGVVEHVLEDDVLADLQFVVELPITHEVA